MMRWLGFIVAIVLVGLALGSNSSNASAHAQFVRSQPEANAVLAQSPIEVLIWFTESVEIGFSEIQVVDATGARQDNGDTHVHNDPTNPGVTLKPNLLQGTYTVAWRVLSAVDGHRTAGTFAFTVGVAPIGPPQTSETPPDAFAGSAVSAPPRWLAIANRWLAFIAMAALIGAVVFPAIVLPAGLRTIEADGRTVEAIARKVSRIVRATIISALAVIVITTALSLWMQGWAASGQAHSFEAMQTVWTDTRFGEILTLRVSIIVGAVLLGALALPKLRELLARSELLEPAWVALAICAFALPLTTSLNSHAAAERATTELYVASDWLHLVAGSVWIGGLLQLVMLTPAIMSLTDHRASFLAGVIPRFSLVALASVTVVVATGVFQWLHFLGGITAVFDSNWGYTLAVKITLLLPLLLLAAFNLLVVRPRFVSFVFGGLKTASSRVLKWERRFRWAVAGEVGFAAAILLVAALLTESTIPVRGTAAGTNGNTIAGALPTPSQLVQSIDAGDLNIALDIYPGRAGPNDLGIFLTDLDGDEKPVQNVIVRYKYLDRPHGVIEDSAEPFHPPTHYTLTTSQLSLAGKWEVEVIVRREGLLDARATFDLNVPA
jgi:copper transport protein